jgi:hypothetical protein
VQIDAATDKAIPVAQKQSFITLAIPRFRMFAILLFASLYAGELHAAPKLEVSPRPASGAPSIRIADGHGATPIIVSDNDYAVVRLAAGLFADDVERVTGARPSVSNHPKGREAIIVGTLGHSAIIDRIVRSGKLKQLDRVRGHWEATLSEEVDNPLPGVRRALVIVGSDRRGAAYGLTTLSRKIGVSPWYWWADAPVIHRAALYAVLPAPDVDLPAVRYRGLFINDEDWGIVPWIKTNFNPKQGNFGPKSYEKIFELLLRLRLNYLWPAMHGVSTEFGAIPENAALADRYGIVMGSSHCEPMLYNNVHWNEKSQGNWDYTVNKPAIQGIWAKTVNDRSAYEAVWTMGIRGIHDAGMEGPRDTPTRMATLSDVFGDQQALLDNKVTRQWGSPARIFIPYKEVLPIYDAGLSVPTDASLVWVDDNFGFIRRLSNPAERRRAGGSGVYWHLSYYGGPHSYTWINTTPPALIWEELHKAWENDARSVWVINVGDIKPMEIGISYFSTLAWAPDANGPDSASQFLRDFADQTFGHERAPDIAAFLSEYYRLGSIRKPELMNRAWALSLTSERAAELARDYAGLLRREKELADALPPAYRDAFIETIGFPARVVATSGLIFMADRNVRNGVDVTSNAQEIIRLRDDLGAQVANFNTQLAGGKWNGMMPGLVTGKDLTSWSSQVRWPWADDGAKLQPSGAVPSPAEANWRPAAAADNKHPAAAAAWRLVPGLGTSGKAMAVLPASLQSSWRDHPADAPFLDYGFTATGIATDAYVDFLPSFRIYPGMKLAVRISIDGAPSALYEILGSSGSEDENGDIRRNAVQDNYVRLHVPLPPLAPGKHAFRISAVDPGVVVDRVWLP